MIEFKDYTMWLTDELKRGFITPRLLCKLMIQNFLLLASMTLNLSTLFNCITLLAIQFYLVIQRVSISVAWARKKCVMVLNFS